MGDHVSSPSLVLTTFSFPALMGVEVTKLPPSVSERLSEPGLTLNRRLLGGAVAAGLDFWIGTEEVGEWAGLWVAWPGEEEDVRSGRLRKMEGEKVSSLLAADFSLESGDRKPVSRWVV